MRCIFDYSHFAIAILEECINDAIIDGQGTKAVAIGLIGNKRWKMFENMDDWEFKDTRGMKTVKKEYLYSLEQSKRLKDTRGWVKYYSGGMIV